MDPTQLTDSRQAFFKALLITGVVAGTLDITGACINAYLAGGRSPLFVLQYVASAVLGKDSFGMGMVSGMAGLAFHFIIALSWTALFFVLYPKVALLSKNRVVVGLLYGVFVWIMMNLVVLKLIGMGRAPFNLQQAAIGMGILMVCIGLPISIGASRYFSR